jgi:hypothetical protein
LLATFAGGAKAEQLTARREIHYLPAKPIRQPPIFDERVRPSPAERLVGRRNSIQSG